MEWEDTEIVSVQRGYVKKGEIWGCRIRLSDGSVHIVPLSLAEGAGWAPGDPVDRDRRESLRRGALLFEINGKALDYLDRREHSRQELRLKLEKKFSLREDAGSCIREVLEDLAARGCLNDLRFAENWLYFRLKRRPEGPVRLRQGLASKGISREIISQVLDEGLPEGEILDALDRAGEKLLRNGRLPREKLAARLVARGFSYGRVKNWMEERGI